MSGNDNQQSEATQNPRKRPTAGLLYKWLRSEVWLELELRGGNGILEESLCDTSGRLCLPKRRFCTNKGHIQRTPVMSNAVHAMLKRESTDSLIAIFVDRRCFFAQVIRVLSILILLDQALDDFLSFVELAESILERRLPLVAF